MTEKIKNIIIEDEGDIAESEVQYNNLDARLQSSIDIANYLVQNDVSSNVFKEEYFGYGNKGTDTTVTNRLGYKPEYLINIDGLKSIIVNNSSINYDIAVVLHATKSTSTQVYDSGWINASRVINILSYPTAHYAAIRIRFKNDSNIDLNEIANITNIILYFILDINENNINTERLQTFIDDNEDVVKSKKAIEGYLNGGIIEVNSISEMTNTTRIYVNSTDRKWYYYNGSSWIAGGTYQDGGYEDLENKIYNLIVDGSIRLDSDNFLNRGLNNQGTFNNLKYRVSNTDIQVADRNMTFKAKEGFRFYVYTWGTVSEPSETTTMVGWFTEYTFNEGERYKISIARASDVTSEEANISFFVSQIEVLTYISTLATKEYVDMKDNNYKYGLPSYYNDYFNNKITSIHELEMNAGMNSVTYAFITDFHIPSNKKKSIALLERIKERTNATHLFYGGDSPSALGTLDDLKNQNYEVARLLYSIYGENYHYILGNHDYTIATGGSWGQGMESISTNAVHSIYKKGIDNPNRNYHLFDDEFNKIRHVFMDYTQAQTPWFLEWFRDTALNIPNDWNICFYCHLPFVDIEGAESAPDYMKKIANWICAFNNHTTFNATFAYSQWTTNIDVDYSNIQSKVIYGAFGHIHKDSLTLKNGVYFFSTTCDAMYQDDGYGRTEGTVNENAFDVIHINESTKTVNLVRIGAGSDRSFVYSGN